MAASVMFTMSGICKLSSQQVETRKEIFDIGQHKLSMFLTSLKIIIDFIFRGLWSLLRDSPSQKKSVKPSSLSALNYST